MASRAETAVLARFQRALLGDLEPTEILRNFLEVATEEGLSLIHI